MLAAVDRPVTLKLRGAFHESDKERDAFWRIAEAAFDASVRIFLKNMSKLGQKGPPIELLGRPGACSTARGEHGQRAERGPEPDGPPGQTSHATRPNWPR